jgi:hypothetical protein
MRRSAAPSKRTGHLSAPPLADQNKRSTSDQPENGRSAARPHYEIKRQRVISQDNDTSATESTVQKGIESRFFSIVWRKQTMKKVMGNGSMLVYK